MLPLGVTACALCPGGVVATHKDGRLATWRRGSAGAGWVCLQRTQRGLYPPLAHAVLAEHAAVLVGVDQAATLWVAHADNVAHRGPAGILEIASVSPDGFVCLVRRADDTLLVDCMTGGVTRSLPPCARGTWARSQFVYLQLGALHVGEAPPVPLPAPLVAAGGAVSVTSPQEGMVFVCTASGEVYAWNPRDGFGSGSGVASSAREQYSVACGGHVLSVQRCLDRGGYRVFLPGEAVPRRCVFSTTRPSVQASRMLLTRDSDGALTVFDPERMTIEDDFD